MFSKSIDKKIKRGIIGAGLGVFVLATVGFFGMQNRVTDVGYRPQQPIAFSHKMHAGDNAIPCQYCHAGVEKSEHSPVPPLSTCMGCHVAVGIDNPKVEPLRKAWEEGRSIEWRRVHKLPDYVFFNHSRHIRAQIDCKSCHGAVEEQGVVAQNKPLSMGWCLDCHRNPEQNIVPARMISGIFTGHRVDYVNKDSLYKSIEPNLVKGVADRVQPITNPQFGQFESKELPKPEQGIPHPKAPGYGPENCSSCHH